MSPSDPIKPLPVRIPLSLWDQFYHLFPGRGERVQFLIRCITAAVDLGKEEKFENKVLRKILEED